MPYRRTLESLWTLKFQGTRWAEIGSGIAVLESGRVLGGDACFTYMGEYSVTGNKISARVNIQKFEALPGVVSGTGMDSYWLVLEGAVESPVMTLQGHVEGAPHIKMQVVMTRRIEELPKMDVFFTEHEGVPAVH